MKNTIPSVFSVLLPCLLLSFSLFLSPSSCQVVSGTSIQINPTPSPIDAVVQPNEYRFINGSNNNLQNPRWGAALSVMVPYYYDLVVDPNFRSRSPNPRTLR
eukprot:TRINITY_DN5006_c0_g1_i1.p1 TRINITY_DN5006_c0_g1~~TRINITY_DN5006_c0_g1_i1.p1  ORF type:complete len:102 (+),score=27.21 TRINITY_DN5006_c0_g1_i1:327-632(+)